MNPSNLNRCEYCSRLIYKNVSEKYKLCSLKCKKYFRRYKPNNELEKIILDGEKIKKLYGLYGTRIDSRNPTGGPFVSYIFKSIKSNRVLIAIGFVNSPGENKVFHMKELEYIIETKKTNERNIIYE